MEKKDLASNFEQLIIGTQTTADSSFREGHFLSMLWNDASSSMLLRGQLVLESAAPKEC